MSASKTKRTHILLPVKLAREIDAIAGRRGRSAFLVETAREAVRRRKLLTFLQSSEPAWKEKGHSELRAGSAEWVRGIRRESDRRVSNPKRRGKK